MKTDCTHENQPAPETGLPTPPAGEYRNSKECLQELLSDKRFRLYEGRTFLTPLKERVVIATKEDMHRYFESLR